jgi:hypothetical protein
MIVGDSLDFDLEQLFRSIYYARSDSLGRRWLDKLALPPQRFVALKVPLTLKPMVS